MELFGNGKLNISAHNRPGIAIGSIEGDGTIFLGANNLKVGRNGLDTTFSGLISDGGFSGRAGGSLTKLKNGKLIVEHANTYTGGTTLEDGVLIVKNARGSGTGTGPVQVNHGTLAGSGIIAGAVTIGSGRGTVGKLGPATDADSPLTIQSELRFNSDGTYAFGLNSNNGTADKVVANGVTIDRSAQFTFSDFGTGKLARGTIFTVISNTSNSAINGTFTNLADSLTFTNRANTYKVNYHGDDGNDLTLTVQ